MITNIQRKIKQKEIGPKTIQIIKFLKKIEKWYNLDHFFSLNTRLGTRHIGTLSTLVLSVPKLV